MQMIPHGGLIYVKAILEVDSTASQAVIVGALRQPTVLRAGNFPKSISSIETNLQGHRQDI